MEDNKARNLCGGAKLKSPNIELMRFLVMLLIMGHHLYHIGLEGTYLTRMNITGTFTPLVRIEETIVPD